MIINLFLKNKLKFEHVNKYQNVASLLVSLHSLYAINYLNDLDRTGILIVTYLTMDILFTTREFFLHHMCGIMMGLFVYNYNIVKPHREFLYRQFINMEISTIFLTSKKYISFLKKYIIANQHNHNKKYLLLIIRSIETINNIAFITSFFKFRVYDYLFKVIINHEVNNIFHYYTQYNIVSNLHIYSSVYTLYGINLYWFNKILKMISRIK